MPIGSPPPRKTTKIGLEREAARRELLDLRRNPPKPKAPKFKKRLLEYRVTVATTMPDGALGRDIPYRVQADDSITAIRAALMSTEKNLREGESVCFVKCGEPTWVKTHPMGRAEE